MKPQKRNHNSNKLHVSKTLNKTRRCANSLNININLQGVKNQIIWNHFFFHHKHPKQSPKTLTKMTKLRTSNPLRITTLQFFVDDFDSFLLSLASRTSPHRIQPQTVIHSPICPLKYLKAKQKLTPKNQ